MAKKNTQSIENTQDGTQSVEVTPEQAKREADIAKLLTALRLDTTTSKEKKVIRRVLRETYNYYISKNRQNVTNELIDKILAD